ncbi:microtubule-associated tumor suppressor 1 homolog A isoform X3 [Girardinichthys multiradiatus]|uniref:microtubule-associated tumor suppressor 1 homolog A isoform X3 n=1 Tax=Girardinichthys multiradiatus TaxID=208333 RepID=UPI001FAE402F|nr:microtubule-associated tumor suppressor 1 homolog A isoform X3 [Girardinichthys multiradiatus]
MDSEDVQASPTDMMDYSAISRGRFYSEIESHPNSKMAKTFNLPGETLESSVATKRRDGRFSTSPDSDGISSLSEREARGSPYINTDCCLNEHSPGGNSHTSTLPQDLLSVVTSGMNEAFIVTPVNGDQNSWNTNFGFTHSRQTGSEMHESFCKHEEHAGKNDEICSESVGREGKLSLSDISCRRSNGNEFTSLSSGEMVVRSHSFCLEEQSLIAFSSLEDSSISPAASAVSVPSESNLQSAALPDVCKTSTERATTERMGHHSLGVTFTQANSMENLTEEEDIATFTSLVPLPCEGEGGLYMTFICETPIDQTKQPRSSGAEAELLQQVSEELTPELGKTFVSTMSGMQDTDDDVHTSTPVQCIGNKIPSLSFLSPCIENVICPGFQLEKRQQTSVTSKGRQVASVTPSVCKVNKTELQKATKSELGAVKSKVLTRMLQHAAVPGTAKLRKSMQVNKHSEVNKRTTFRIAASKVMSRCTGVPAVSKTSDSNGQVNKRDASSGVTAKQLCGPAAASSPDHHPDVKEHVSVSQCSESSCEGTRGSTNQVSEASAQHAASLSCASSAEKSSARNGQVDPKATPKKDVLNKIGVRSGSASGKDRPNVSMMRPCWSSEGLSSSRPPKEKKAAQWATASFTVSHDDIVKTSTKAGNPKCPSWHKHIEETNSPADNSRGVKKISLVAETSKSTMAGAQLNESKSRSQGQPSPRRGRGASLSQPPAASPRPSPLSTRQKLGALGRVESKISRTVGKVQSNITSEGSQRAQATEEPPIGIKHQQNASRPSQTPSRSSLMGPPPTPAVRLPRKIPGLCQESKSTPVSGGAAHKPTPIKSVVLKARLISTPAKNSGSAVTTACMSATSTSKVSSSSAVSPHIKPNYGRPVGLTHGGTVDKNKPKTNSRLHQQQHSWAVKTTGSQTVAQEGVLQDERRDQNIQQLKELLAASNCRFQALTIVLQQTLAERDEATRQCRRLSQELVDLKGELDCSVHLSECLEREKKELHATLHNATQKLQDEHKKELAELEQKLEAVYKAEWDNVHLTYQEEANKYKTLMQQQMEELKANHEAMKLQLESSHAEQLQSVKQQYEMSLEELRKVHTQEMQSFEQTLKDAEAAMSKDSHTLYLEQELESLKVVLDIKNKQLHQQEKKLMGIGKLTEKNVKLDEILIKVKQENEDLKARMERHAALSRQLSTEQTMLQESLQKESKVNKRLSMENEELLWKLHNGDLNSPRKVSPSPTSPSHSFRLQSPRSSGFFSSPPVSPR